MKTCCLVIAMFVLTCNCLLGEVKNGYESEINKVRASLKSLQDLLATDKSLSFTQRAEMRSAMDRLITYISYYELTDGLLAQFRIIAPDLYNQIDTLTDRSGHCITVFVRFVSDREMQHGAAGTTNIAQLEDDKDAYTSEYGPFTVSIKIASVNKALQLLAHEFGHVKHQVPNLAAYIVFYSNHYQNGTFRSSYIGHNANDASGRQALYFENAFRERYASFSRTTTDKIGSPMAMLQEIRKRTETRSL